ncbi:MAG: ribosome assembly RNA-binding protein YhbY [Calditrichaeota bacterium]|nr:MAG: ribosome assembly RNA-binding protein YhbY [Calditrichota bacterium]
MENLTTQQKSRLRGLANPLKPLIFIGKNGLTEDVAAAVNEALDAHELIKIKFLEFKEEKKALVKTIEGECQAECVGVIGHVAIFYRQNKDPKRRKIEL